VTDRGDVSGTGWWSPANEGYAVEVLDLPTVDLDPALLPTVLGPGDAAGTVRPAVAEELGLSPGVLVGPGTGDNMAAALGIGHAVGQAIIGLGTSGTVFAVSERPAADPTGVVAGFADASGRFLTLACTLNCTLAVDRARLMCVPTAWSKRLRLGAEVAHLGNSDACRTSWSSRSKPIWKMFAQRPTTTGGSS
jgi:xylulokinase